MLVRGLCSWLFAGVALLAAAGPARAVTFTAPANAQALAPTADFSLSGRFLTIVLTNTDPAPSGSQWAPSEPPTGLFFNLGTSVLSPTGSSATVPPGGSATNGAGEWADQYAVGAYFIERAGGNLDGANLDSTSNRNGFQFGMLAADLRGGPLNPGQSGAPLIRAAVMFVLDVPDTLITDAMSNLTFTSWQP
jgi:hypothetical protein